MAGYVCLVLRRMQHMDGFTQPAVCSIGYSLQYFIRSVKAACLVIPRQGFQASVPAASLYMYLLPADGPFLCKSLNKHIVPTYYKVGHFRRLFHLFHDSNPSKKK